MIESSTKSSFVSDDLVRRFLLGQLNDAERSAFESSLMADDALEKRVRLAEFSLTDDFVCDRLSSVERDSFKRTFLVTANRRRALNVSRALHQHFASVRIAQEPFWQTIRQIDWHAPAWRYAFAVLVLTGLMVTAWLAIKEPRIVERVLPMRQLIKPKNATTPQETHHPSRSGDLPAHPEASPATALHQEPDVTISLKESEQATALVLPENVHLIRMRLMLEQSETGNYQISLLTVSGQDTFASQTSLSEAATFIDFDVPVEMLRSGEYQIRVSGPDPNVTRNYYFRVQ